MRFVRTLLVLLLVAIVLAAVLAWTAPAEIAYRFLKPRLGPVELSGLTGSVWDGRAEQATAFGVPIGALDWRVEKASALARRLDARLGLSGGGIEAGASVHGDGDVVRLEDLRATLPAALMGPALDIPALVLTGEIALDVSEAEVTQGLLTRATGTATWRDIGVLGAAVASLPGIRAEFAPRADGAIEARLSDLGGALAVDGTVVIRDGTFDSETRLSLRDPDSRLAEVLKFVGERTPDGGSLLRIEGELKPLW